MHVSQVLVWKSLLDEMEEQVSKTKRVSLDDQVRALDKLSPGDSAALSAWVKTEGHSKKCVPAKAANEAVVTLRHAVLMSCGARDYSAINVCANASSE